MQQLTIRTREKVGVMLQYISLMFPHGLILRVVLPLHLVELYHTVSGHSFFLIQDFDRVLNISQIRLEGKPFNFHSFIRHPQTFLQLGDVKHIMYHRQDIGKLETIRHWATLCQNLVGTHISGS